MAAEPAASADAIHLFDTLSRSLQPLGDASPLGIYVCGPTVYDLSHIGHARVYVVFDTLVRFLRARGPVRYVRNYTDIDDKIIARAQKTKQDPTALAAGFIEEFRRDLDALGCLPADEEPKVSDHIGHVVEIIGELVAKGDAYAAGGDVFFAVQRFATYGRLGRRSLEDMEAGARVEVSRLKRHPMDFVLWKAAKPGEPAWPSPWGEGRPGWHIECSAMSRAYLGNSFTIHGGGRDLIFPHHENEIAQSEAVSGQTLARIWMHGGLVNINNQKMSKSLGNFFLIRDVLARFDPQALRFFLLSTHYRAPIAFSDAGLHEATGRVVYFYQTLSRLRRALAEAGEPAAESATPVQLTHPRVGDMLARFHRAMADDLNTPQALGDLSEIFRHINDVLVGGRPASAAALATLRAIDASLKTIGGSLGLFMDEPEEVLARIETTKRAVQHVDADAIEALVAKRRDRRAARDFAAADEIRRQLQQMGVEINDQGDATLWHMA